MRLIDADALQYSDARDMLPTGQYITREEIDKAAEPIRHGEWRADEMSYTVGEVWCSVCRTLYYIGDLYDVGDGNNLPNYCPNCGAKMDEEENT